MIEETKKSSAPWAKLSEDELSMAVAYLKDDVLAKLVDAFYETRDKEGWTRRDIAGILGCDETHISHILNGRRSNLTLASIATLAKALRKRAELTLVDIRPHGNRFDAPVSAPSVVSDRDPVAEVNSRWPLNREGTGAASALGLATAPYSNRDQELAYGRAVRADRGPLASAAEGIKK